MNGMTSSILYICSKASKRLYSLRLLKRSGAPVVDLRSFYCCFLRPILEYACPVWRLSLTQKHRNQVEQVQSRATKIMLPDLSYSERITELELDTTSNDRREILTHRFYASVLDKSCQIHDLSDCLFLYIISTI